MLILVREYSVIERLDKEFVIVKTASNTGKFNLMGGTTLIVHKIVVFRTKLGSFNLAVL